MSVLIVGIKRSSWSFLPSWLFRFLFALDFSVLDVNTIFVDVSFLMVRSELLFAVSFHEDVFIARCDGDIIVEFFDFFVRELMEEVNDESSWDLIDFDP